MGGEMMIVLLPLEGLFWLWLLKPPTPLYWGTSPGMGLLEGMQMSAAPRSREQYLG